MTDSIIMLIVKYGTGSLLLLSFLPLPYVGVTMREKDFEKQVVSNLQEKGFMVYYNTSPRHQRGDKGFPDVVAVSDSGLLVFLELKCGRRKATKEQLDWIDRLNKVQTVQAAVINQRDYGERLQE